MPMNRVLTPDYEYGQPLPEVPPDLMDAFTHGGSTFDERMRMRRYLWRLKDCRCPQSREVFIGEVLSYCEDCMLMWESMWDTISEVNERKL